jgi:two-component system chemotaxis response regulator CheY
MKKTVLIVDDVAFVRKTLAEILSESGYHVVGEAADGKEAVALYLKLRPNLVTMDVVMPNLGGIEATKEIMKSDKNAVVVMVSAMDQVHLVMEAIHVGAKDYIQKPFHTDDVRNVLSRALNGDAPADTGSPAASPRAG